MLIAELINSRMEVLIVAIFIIGYIAIAFEQRLKISKTATALLTGVLCWTLFAISLPAEPFFNESQVQSFLSILKEDVGIEKFSRYSANDLFHSYLLNALGHHLSEIAQILFFLLSAMTIVELIDAHDGFRIITDKIKTRNPKKLLWIICWITFLLSAVLDNLTSAIVMVSLVRKLIPIKEMRLLFVGMIVIAANAGGAWTPIGDVTTTMLWIGGQITAFNIMKTLFLPSVVSMLLPLLYFSLTLKGALGDSQEEKETLSTGNGKLMFALGLGILILVPVFKVATHLPPYIGILGGLSILWIVSEFINPELDEASKKKYSAAGALERIDVPSILFFLGILLAVGALESMMTLQHLAEYLTAAIGNNTILITLTGILSAVVDNVPLVAATMGMYDLNTYPVDHLIWEYLAYCAGTGGSLLIIGSAAGVAAMGMEKIDFTWYLKKMSAIALMGYIGGALVYLLLQSFLPAA